jgi:hypothetical protein
MYKKTTLKPRRTTPKDPSLSTRDLRKFGLFGYEIGGWGAALAFLLASTGLIWQSWAYFVGPDARILSMRGVELTCSNQNGEKCEPGANLILVANRLAFVNFGAEGYDALIDPGSVRVEFLDEIGESVRSITLDSLYFTERTQIAFEQKPASRIFLKAGAGVDYEVAYYPRMKISNPLSVNRENFLLWADFKSLLVSEEFGGRVRVVRATFLPKAMGRNRGSLVYVCNFFLDVKMRDSASRPDVGTFPRDCIAEDCVVRDCNA